MRWALAFLLVAVCAAWFRNFRFPGYLLLVKHKAWIQARRDEQHSRDGHGLIQNDILQVMTEATPISKAEWTQYHTTTDGWFGELIEEKDGRKGIGCRNLDWQNWRR
jgi:hypothetical protein